MKVLLISAYFPPGNAIGAVRLGKLARYLAEQGCEVRVICAVDESLSQTLPIEIEPGHVFATKWFDLHSLPRRFMGLKYNNGSGPNGLRARLIALAYNWFRAIFHWPDRHVGWYFPACRFGRELAAEWKPDVIYASAWPVTSLFVGATLSKEFSIPWIAELRDLWLDNHYYHVPVWRRWIDRIIERKLLTSAALLVTVSEPLADVLRRRFSRPTAVVLNGFDPLDIKESDNEGRSDVLTITYTGMIYPGRRDPRPLFEALKRMGPLAKRIRVRFIGRVLPGVQDMIESYGLEDCVEICAPVPYRDALKIQAQSDVLLLLMWDSPEEMGVYTGKLFEYLGARRPILSLGLEQGVAADLILQRGAGVVTKDPVRVALALRQWLAEKDAKGQVESLDRSVCRGLSRQEQFDRLLPLIQSVASVPLRKTKVLVVTRKLDIGGSERHVVQVLPRLLTKFDVAVSLLYAGGQFEYELTKSGVAVHAPPIAIGPFWGRVWAVVWLAVFLMRNRDAVIHFFLPEAYLIGGICGAVLGHPRMAMSRRSLNVYQEEYPVLAIIEKKLHRRMRVCVANSQAVLSNLLEEGVPKSRTRLIYNGVDMPVLSGNEVRRALRARYGIAPGDFVIISVANLIPYKGHEDLIHALGQVASVMAVPWRLLLIGRDDGIQARLEQLVDSLNLAGHVIFGGHVDVSEGLWAIGDIGVLASHQEGFSNSILEGMAAGLPMVVTNVGGNAEAVLHEVTGLVVPPRSPFDLGNAILVLATDLGNRKLYGEAARRRARECFSVQACANAYEELYMSITG